MKKVRASVQRILSVMLATAMVATAVPQTGMYAFAQEEGADIEQVVSVDDEGIVSSDEGENQEESQGDVEDENTPSDEENVDADAPAEDDDADDNVSDDADVTDSEDEENLAMEEEVLYASPEDDEADVMPLEDEGEDGEPDVTEEHVITIPIAGENFTLEAAENSENVKIESNSLKITLPKGEKTFTAEFKIVPQVGYTVQRIQRSKDVALQYKDSATNASGTISPRWVEKTGICKITFNMRKGTLDDVAGISGQITAIVPEIRDYKWTFTYSENTDVKVQKYNSDGLNEDISLTADDAAGTYTASISNDTYVVILAKPNQEKDIPFIVQDKGDEDAEIEYTYDEMQDGYYVFDIGKKFSDTTFDIVTSEVWNVTFKSTLEDIFIEFEDTSIDVELETPYMVKKGDTIRFNVEVYSINIGDIEVRADGVLLEKKFEGDEEEGYYSYYECTPAKDTDITIDIVAHEIPLEYDDDALTDVQISWDGGEEWSEVDKSIVFSDFENDRPKLKFKTAEGVRLKGINLTSYDDDEPYFIEASEIELGEDGYYVFSKALSGYTKVTIITERYKTIDLYIRGVNVYNLNVWYEEEGGQPNYDRSYEPFADETEGNTVKHSIDVSSDGSYYFAVSRSNRLGYGIFVSTTGDERGRIEPIYKEADNYNYYKVDMSESINTLYVLAETHVISIKDDFGVIDKLEVTTDNPDTTTFNRNRDEVEILRSDDITVRFLPKEAAKEAQIGAYYVLRESVSDDGEEHYENKKYSVDDLTKEEDGYYSFALSVDSSYQEIGITSDKSFNTESKIVLEYETEAIQGIVAVIDGKTIEASRVDAISGGRSEAVYVAGTDRTVTFKISAGSSYRIVKSTLIQGDSTEETDVASLSTYTTSVSATSNARLRIDTVDVSGQPRIFVTLHELVDGGMGDEVERAGGTKTYITNQYKVRAGKKYAISLYTYGTQVLPELTSDKFRYFETEINKSNKTVEVKVFEDSKGGNYQSINFRVPDPDSARTLSVKVMLIVTEDIGSVKLAGVKDDGNGAMVMERTVDTRRIASVTPRGVSGKTGSKVVDISRLGYEFIPEEGVTQGMLDVQFTPRSSNIVVAVTIGPDVEVGKKLGTIRFYNKDSDQEIENGTFYVRAAAPTTLMETKPEVKVSYLDDISMILDVSSAGEITVPYKGKQYYKVEVNAVPAEGKTVSTTIQEAIKNPFYFEREIPKEISTDDDEDIVYETLWQKLRIRVDSEELRGLIEEDDTCKFSMTVSIVQTKDGTVELTAENEKNLVRFRTNDDKKATVETETVSSLIETKLTLKKGTTKLFTGQKDVVAATAKFQASTKTRWVEVKDATAELKDAERLDVRFEDNKILVSASAQTALGKHMLEVQPSGPATMYRPVSTLTVTVEKGIDTIVLTSPTSVYKKANKAASLQVKVSYNPDDVQPKSKKVKCSIVDVNGDELTYDAEVDDAETEGLYKYVTVNASGKVSINKKLDTSEGTSYSFRVKAVANDYKGNTVTALTDVITVTPDALEYKALALATSEDGEIYEVIATDTTTPTVELTTNQLNNAVLIALPAGVEVGDSVSLDDGISVENLTVKSSNNKAVAVQIAEDRIRVLPLKPAKNVKLTVTLADGSKNSLPLKLTVKAATPEKLRLSVEKDGKPIKDVSEAGYDKISFSGTVNTKLTLRVMQGERVGDSGNYAFKPLDAYTNHTVKITGGKLLSSYSDAAAGIYTVIVTSETATVTLKDTYHNTPETYKITNSIYSSAKAPKISIVSGTNKTIWSGEPDDSKAPDRKLKYQVGSTYTSTGKSVLVEVSAADEEAAEKKRPGAYAQLKAACLDMGKKISVDGGSFTLNFNEKAKIPAGSYKLTLTLGAVNADGVFEADAKPVTITVKAAAPKKTSGSYKAETSYKIVKTPGAASAVEFKGKTEKAIRERAVYTEILASNVKGKSNKFRDYFEIANVKNDQGETVSKLQLKGSLTPEQINAIAKDDLTGYVTYTVSYGDDGYGHPTTETKTVKITVKLVAPSIN